MNDLLEEVEAMSKNPRARKILEEEFIKHHKTASSNWEEWSKVVEIAKRRINTTELRKEAAGLRKKKIEQIGKCEICDFSYKRILHMHHILPFRLGGNNDDDNLAVVCPTCHKLLHAAYQDALIGDLDIFGMTIIKMREIYGEDTYSRFAKILNKFIDNFITEEDQENV